MRHIGKGLWEFGPLAFGYFDGPEFLIAWRRVQIWHWRRRDPAELQDAAE